MTSQHKELSKEHCGLMRDVFGLEKSLTDKLWHQNDRFAKLELQAAQNTSAIQLEAAKNQAALVSQMMNCCCEIKQKVSASESNISALINSQNAERLRDSLSRAETKNAILQACGHRGRY